MSGSRFLLRAVVATAGGRGNQGHRGRPAHPPRPSRAPSGASGGTGRGSTSWRRSSRGPSRRYGPRSPRRCSSTASPGATRAGRTRAPRAWKRRCGRRSWPGTTRSPPKPRHSSSGRRSGSTREVRGRPVLCRHGETALRRMGGHELLWGRLFQRPRLVRETQGRLAEAVEDPRLAIAAKQRALGRDAADVGISVTPWRSASCARRPRRAGSRLHSAPSEIRRPALDPSTRDGARPFKKPGRVPLSCRPLREASQPASARSPSSNGRRIRAASTSRGRCWTLGLVRPGARRAAEALPPLERPPGSARRSTARPPASPRCTSRSPGRSTTGRANTVGRRARPPGPARVRGGAEDPRRREDLADLDRWLAAER